MSFYCYFLFNLHEILFHSRANATQTLTVNAQPHDSLPPTLSLSPSLPPSISLYWFARKISIFKKIYVCYTLHMFSFIGNCPAILGNLFTIAWPLAAHNRGFYDRLLSLSPLRPSHCVLPPLHRPASVCLSEPLLLLFFFFFFFSPSVTHKPGPVRGRHPSSPPAPSLPLESESLTRPQQLWPNRPTQQKRLARVMGEGRARRQGDTLSPISSAPALTS